MKVKLLIILNVIVFNISTVMTQETYWKSYNVGGGGPQKLSIVQTSDSGIAMSGYIIQNKSMIMKQLGDSILFCNFYSSNSGTTEIHDFIELPDKGFIGCGRSKVSSNNYGIYIIRIDSVGNLLWGNSFTGSSTFDIKSLVQFDNFNQFLMVGSTQGNMGVIIFDINGNIVSSNKINEISIGTTVIQSNDNGFVIAGSTFTLGAGGWDILLVKLDSLGNIEWSKTYGWPATEYVYSIIQSFNGGYLITGTTTLLDNDRDMFISEVDSSGVLLWSKIYESNGVMAPHKTKAMNDSTYTIAGADNHLTGYLDHSAININLDGDINWSRFYANSFHDRVNDFLVMPSNQILMTGFDFTVGSPADYLSLIKLNLVGDIGCFTDTLAITVLDTVIYSSNPSLVYTSFSISINDTTNTVYAQVVTIDTLCYCSNLAVVDFYTSLCYSDTIQFNSLAIPNNINESLLWDFGDGNTSNSFNPKHVYLFSGQYDVTLTFTDSTGCTSVKNKIINYIPYSSTALFDYSTNGLNVNFTDTLDFSTSWSWEFGDGATDSIWNPIHIYDSAGLFQVCLTSSNNCGYDSICDSIQVCTPMINGFTYSDTALTFNFLDTSLGNVINWFWDFGDGDIDSVQNPLHIFPNSGTYLVCLTTMDLCSSNYSCDSVDVIVLSNSEINNNQQINIFPNPLTFSTMMVFNNPAREAYTLTIYNASGQVVRIIKNITTEQIIFNRKHLPNGNYFYELHNYNQIRYSGNLIIE